MLIVEGRTIYVVRGKGKSDTVNICDANNRRGDYDWIVRIFKPTNVTEQEISGFNRIEDLVHWLLTERKGSLEERPEGMPKSVRAVVPRAGDQFDPLKDAWAQEAKWLVEHTLDQLVH